MSRAKLIESYFYFFSTQFYCAGKEQREKLKTSKNFQRLVMEIVKRVYIDNLDCSHFFLSKVMIVFRKMLENNELSEET